ncbi:MAG: hypothetical protein PVF30_14525, partial [Desulfobacterales bacterium]
KRLINRMVTIKYFSFHVIYCPLLDAYRFENLICLPTCIQQLNARVGTPTKCFLQFLAQVFTWATADHDTGPKDLIAKTRFDIV